MGERCEQGETSDPAVGVSRAFSLSSRALDWRPQIWCEMYRFVQRAGRFITRAILTVYSARGLYSAAVGDALTWVSILTKRT